jgi:nucleoside-diphosphate-sugar epimerase/uncharacterized membrane protein
MTASSPPANPRSLVIVTGGTGFIGRAVVHHLVHDHAVVVFDQKCPPEPPAGADCMAVDLTSDDSVRDALQRVRSSHGDRIASVIHLAAYFDLEGKPHPDYERVTVQGTQRLLRSLQAFQLEQFVFASTMLVHAPGRPGEKLNEDSPLDMREPRLPYRDSKLRTEALVREQHGDVPLVVVRPAGVYDDGGHAVFIAHQIARIFERKLNSRVYPGNLGSGQPYLHLDDLAQALVRIVQRRSELPRETTLLLAETDTPTFGELQDEIGRLVHGHDWPTLRIPQPLAKVGAALEEAVLDEDPFIRPWMVTSASDHYEIDISRARQLLGWSPTHSLRATLPKIVQALQADPAGWYRSNKLNPSAVVDKTHQVREPMAPAPAQDMAQHEAHMRDMHFGLLWVHFLVMALGAWLLSSPWALGLFDAPTVPEAVRQVSADRGLPDPLLRLAWLGRSDLVAGALLLLFGAMSLAPRWSWAQWASAAVGLWLLAAPLVFWSPSAAAYHNDTLVGALAIAFSVVVPMMPGMAHEGMMDASDMPPGWTYSPSAYLQRVPIIAFALLGFLIARQLTAYQLGHVDHVWEPFFGGGGGRNGTETVITSQVSKAWPIPDAGLGAVTYLLETLMGAMGDGRRWRTMPWMVAAFGIVVVPLGVISIYFIIIQPIVIGTWCTLCLVAAAAMLVMVPYTLDELVATGQFLVQSRRRGEPVWRVFFMGGAAPGAGHDTRQAFDAPLSKSLVEALDGVNPPWTLVAVALLGAWLMFTRLVFGTEPPMAHSDHLTGALVLVVAVTAMAEVGRMLRLLNVALGAWLVAAPWLLSGASTSAKAGSVAVGAAIVLLSLPRGHRSREHYGNWDRFVL